MSLVSPKEADVLAEKFIKEYTQSTGASSAEDLRKVMELMMSKAARAIEKYCGNDIAAEVTLRTAYQIQTNPSVKITH